MLLRTERERHEPRALCLSALLHSAAAPQPSAALETYVTVATFHRKLAPNGDRGPRTYPDLPTGRTREPIAHDRPATAGRYVPGDPGHRAPDGAVLEGSISEPPG